MMRGRAKCKRVELVMDIAAEKNHREAIVAVLRGAIVQEKKRRENKIQVTRSEIENIFRDDFAIEERDVAWMRPQRGKLLTGRQKYAKAC